MGESDRRLTPEWLLNVVREFGPIGLDPCTELHNPVGARTWLTFEDDGLNAPWETDLNVWCNPPYSRGQLLLWAGKAITETRAGCEILMLTPADSTTRWYRLLADNADARCLLSRRVGFLEPDGAGGWRELPGAKGAACIWHFGTQRRRFARIFGAHGEVIAGDGPQELGVEVAKAVGT